MAKRRATSDTDEEDQLENSQALKRARTQDESDDEPEMVHPKREKTNGKGKGKSKRKNDDDSDSEVEQPTAEQNEEEEKLFEEAHGDAIRAAIEAKRKVHGVSFDFQALGRDI